MPREETMRPDLEAPLLRPCGQDEADILWHDNWHQLCGRKAFVLVREYWEWTRGMTEQQRPHMIRAALKEAQASQRKRLTMDERREVIQGVEDRIALSMRVDDVPVRVRFAYNPYTEEREVEGWDQLEQRLRDRWGPLWAESMTWPNPLWTEREIDWAWLDAMRGWAKGEPIVPPKNTPPIVREQTSFPFAEEQ